MPEDFAAQQWVVVGLIVLAVVVICVWIHGDTRSRGKNPWPWIAASFAVGMFSPLVYLLLRSQEKSQG